MKKVLLMVLVGCFVLGGAGIAAFAEDIEAALEEELTEEEKMLESYRGYRQLRDELELLARERKVTRGLLGDIAVKKARILFLKEKAKLNGEYRKLKLAELVEKEIDVFNSVISRIREKRNGLWYEFIGQIESGDIDGAEFTLRKIIVLKKLINENLRHKIDFMDIEIDILN